MLKHLTDAGSQGSFLACSLCKVQHDSTLISFRPNVLLKGSLRGLLFMASVPKANRLRTWLAPRSNRTKLRLVGSHPPNKKEGLLNLLKNLGRGGRNPN